MVPGTVFWAIDSKWVMEWTEGKKIIFCRYQSIDGKVS